MTASIDESRRGGERLPLRGVRVIESGTMVAGPYAAAILGDMGAEVIKIEPLGGDILRRSSLLGNSHFRFNEPNRNKLGVALNLRTATGKQLLWRLVAISDVVVCNLRPDTIPQVGLDYASLRAANEQIVSIRLSAFGASGPNACDRGTAPTIDGASGCAAVNGYEGGTPLRPAGFYADLTSGLFGALGALSALRVRDQHGHGQEVDVAMTECTAHLLGDTVVEHFRSGLVAAPSGNRDLSGLAVPNDCFPSAGADSWIAISIDSDEDWARFCGETGDPPWKYDARFATRAGRQRHRRELNDLVAAWSVGRSDREAMATLQAAGIAAGRVATAGELLADPQLEHRGYFTEVDQQGTGPGPMPRLAFQAPGEAAWERRSAPAFAEHNAYVFNELLRLSDEEVQQLYEDGVSATEMS